MIEKLKETSQILLEKAKERGADEVQIKSSHHIFSKIGFENNDFSLASSGSESQYSLIVYKDKKRGSATTNAIDMDDLNTTVENALTIADFSKPDENLCLPGPSDITHKFDVYDSAIKDLPTEVHRKLAQNFVSETYKDPKISIDSGSVSTDTSFEVLINSNGLNRSFKQTSVSWYLMGMGKTDDEVTGFDYDGGAQFFWDGVEQKALSSARDLMSKLNSSFNPHKGESFKGQVIFGPSALGDILFDTVFYHIDGLQIMDGKSRWEKSLGEEIASKNFNLIDDPFDISLMGADLYDAEGVPAQKAHIFEKGVLKRHFDTTYTAKYRGTTSTGNATGSRSTRPHSLIMSPGEKTLNQMIALPKQTLLVDRFSGNVDPITGDFSGVAKAARDIRNGEDQGPVKETMISGNAFELMKNILEVSKERESFFSYDLLPYFLVDGVSVTAG